MRINKHGNGNGCGKDMILRLRFKFGMIGFLLFYLVDDEMVHGLGTDCRVLRSLS